MNQPIQFSNFTFSNKSGTLTRLDPNGKETTIRLAPQPSKLLLLLLERQPDMVSHAEIKEKIWPDVQVDYEKSLHFCIRQIRAALEDSATEPKFIKTIPRRGYRWICDLNNKSTKPVNQHSQPQKRNNKSKIAFRFFAVAAAILLLFLIPKIGFFSKANHSAKKEGISEVDPNYRIAIMPFQVDDPENDFAKNDIAFHLVEQLTNENKNTLDVIGPTTTSVYTKKKMRQLIPEFNIDYIINGKFSIVQDTSSLLLELIRATDGRHVWVKRVGYSQPELKTVDQIKNGLYEELKNISHEK